MIRPSHVWRALALMPPLLAAGSAIAQSDVTIEEAKHARYVTVSVDLDEKGTVKNCRVTASSGIKELDDFSCEAVRGQGKYEAVLDDDGKPVPATIVHTLTWRAEDEGTQLADKGAKRTRHP